jgi:hypothetical protein
MWFAVGGYAKNTEGIPFPTSTQSAPVQWASGRVVRWRARRDPVCYLHGFARVLGRAPTVEVAQCQVVLCVCVCLVRTLAVPVQRLLVVLLHPNARAVAAALFPSPAVSLSLVLPPTASPPPPPSSVTGPGAAGGTYEVGLCGSVTALSAAAVPLSSAHSVLRHTRPMLVRQSHFVGRPAVALSQRRRRVQCEGSQQHGGVRCVAAWSYSRVSPTEFRGRRTWLPACSKSAVAPSGSGR